MSDSYAAEPTPDLPLIHWVDKDHVTRAPVPAQTLLGWIDAGHLPAETPAWWDGRDGWTTAVELRALVAPEGDTADPTEATQSDPTDDDTTAEPGDDDTEQAPTADARTSGVVNQPRAEPMPAASMTDQFDDQDLDDTFMGLVERSSELYQETERATSMDEVVLGGVIAALGESGFMLIDVLTGGSLRSSGSSTTTQATVPVNRHELRFENPNSGARVALVLNHLTPDVGSAKAVGQRARIEIGYGEQVPNFSQVGRALRQEMASTYVVSPEPGRVTFDADLSSGFVFCQVDLLWDLDLYVDDSINVDADLLRKHLAATVHALRKFLQLRFAN